MWWQIFVKGEFWLIDSRKQSKMEFVGLVKMMKGIVKEELRRKDVDIWLND